MKTQFSFSILILLFLCGCGSDAGVNPNAGKPSTTEMNTAEANFQKVKDLHKSVGGNFDALAPADKTWIVKDYSNGNEQSARMTWQQVGGSKNASRGQ